MAVLIDADIVDTTKFVSKKWYYKPDQHVYQVVTPIPATTGALKNR